MDEEQRRIQERWIDATLTLATAASQLREAVTELRSCVELLSLRLDRSDHAAE